MLIQLVVGTANFAQPYGILSNHTCFTKKESTYILNRAFDAGISKIDTALAYGRITETIPIDLLKKFKIITKVSVLDDQKSLLKKMDIYKGLNLYGLFIHDASNLVQIDKNVLKDNLLILKEIYGIKKIGVSAYDIQEVERFSEIYTPEIIQIPLNPFNQSFDCPSFISWVKDNKIEVHARSLFLQGILLTDTLPPKLEPLRKDWTVLRTILSSFPTPLHGLLIWAASKPWIHHWVIGVSSINDINEIINANAAKLDKMEIPLFPSIYHPLIDPRNW